MTRSYSYHTTIVLYYAEYWLCNSTWRVHVNVRVHVHIRHRTVCVTSYAGGRGPRPPQLAQYLADSMEALFSSAKRSPPRTPGSRRPSSEAHSAQDGRLVWARSSDKRFHQRPRR